MNKFYSLFIVNYSLLCYSCGTAPDFNRLRHYCSRHPGRRAPLLLIFNCRPHYIAVGKKCKVSELIRMQQMHVPWCRISFPIWSLWPSRRSRVERDWPRNWLTYPTGFTFLSGQNPVSLVKLWEFEE